MNNRDKHKPYLYNKAQNSVSINYKQQRVFPENDMYSFVSSFHYYVIQNGPLSGERFIRRCVYVYFNSYIF